MLQSSELTWKFESTLTDHSEFITDQFKKILSKAIKK